MQGQVRESGSLRANEHQFPRGLSGELQGERGSVRMLRLPVRELRQQVQHRRRWRQDLESEIEVPVQVDVCGGSAVLQACKADGILP